MGFEWAEVTEVEDPDNLARIKVRLPWMMENQQSDWIPRVGGGGANYGETGSIPQPKEAVLIHFWHGDMHRMAYAPGSVWTPGGTGSFFDRLSAMPPDMNLVKDPVTGEMKRNRNVRGGNNYHNVLRVPLHKPSKGKYKTWFWQSLGGWLVWIAEDVNWLRFSSPGSPSGGGDDGYLKRNGPSFVYQLDIEHDSAVGTPHPGASIHNRFRLKTPFDNVLQFLERSKSYPYINMFQMTNSAVGDLFYRDSIEAIEREAVPVAAIILKHLCGHLFDMRHEKGYIPKKIITLFFAGVSEASGTTEEALDVWSKDRWFSDPGTGHFNRTDSAGFRIQQIFKPVSKRRYNLSYDKGKSHIYLRPNHISLLVSEVNLEDPTNTIKLRARDGEYAEASVIASNALSAVALLEALEGSANSVARVTAQGKSYASAKIRAEGGSISRIDIEATSGVALINLDSLQTINLKAGTSLNLDSVTTKLTSTIITLDGITALGGMAGTPVARMGDMVMTMMGPAYIVTGATRTFAI